MIKFSNFFRLLRQHEHRTYFRVLVYVLLAAAAFAVLLWRFPNNVMWANFYGEDGSVYLQNILDKGWLEATFTPFNGYGIVGLYVICGLGWIINSLLFGSGLLSLPVAFALSAILFMAAVIALPYLLFANSLGRKKMLFVVIISTLVPLPVSPHIVIGTIGNQKWIFLHLAFLLVVYRVINYKRLSLKRLVAVDALLVISAYTNSTVYLLVPLLLLPYLREYLKNGKKYSMLKTLKMALRDWSFRSLILLYMLLLPQIIFVAVNGIPKLAGYLDTPFKIERAVELFINRTYLFGVTHLINGFLNDILALGLFGFLLFVGLKLLHNEERFIFIAGIYTAGMASLLFVINRPGVTDHFFDYRFSGSGPDQFFYAQTLIMYLPIVLVLFALLTKIKYKENFLCPLILSFMSTGLILAGILSNQVYGENWRNASVFENDAGVFTDNAIRACKTSQSEKVDVVVYPYAQGQFSLKAPANEICNRDLFHNYRLSVDDLGLAINNNDHLPIIKAGQVTQTFDARENDLHGVRIFLSNFGNTVRDGAYILKLLDEGCRATIRSVKIPKILMDNSEYNARFEPVLDSADRVYCVTLEPPSDSHDPIAVQFSSPSLYDKGLLTLNEVPDQRDLVFSPLYEARR